MRKYFRMNRTLRTQSRTLRSFALPVRSFRIVKLTIPNAIPSEMEYAKPIMVMQQKHGIASVRSVQSIFVTCCIIRKPTTISAGAVAKLGIVRNSGLKNSASRKRIPVVTEVRPVRRRSQSG